MTWAFTRLFTPIIFQPKQHKLTESVPKVCLCGYRGCDSEKLEQNFYYHDFCVIQIRMRKHSWILAWARHSPSSLQTSILHWSSYFSSPFIKSTYKYMYTFTYLGVFACLSDLCVVSHSASVMKPWLVTITCAPCEFPHSEMGRNAGSVWKAYTQELLWATVDCYLNAGHCGGECERGIDHTSYFHNLSVTWMYILYMCARQSTHIHNKKRVECSFLLWLDYRCQMSSSLILFLVLYPGFLLLRWSQALLLWKYSEHHCSQRAANTDNSELKVSSQCITVWYCKNWTSFLVLVWRLLRLVHVIVVLFTLDLTLVTLAMFSDIHVTHNPWSHLSCSAIESKDSILVRSVVEYCQCLTANGISLAW